MEIFVSYLHLDKELAGKVKGSLKHYCGLEVFLAHEDINPSSEWVKVGWVFPKD